MALASAPVVAEKGYGGFWIRFLAFAFDLLLVGFTLSLVLALLGTSTLIGLSRAHGRIYGPDFIWLVGAGLTAKSIEIIARWLYEALMTSSSLQATVGKLIFNLKVTDENGNRLTFPHATGRHFAKYVSFFTLCIGFIMAAFTDRKRALHDMIAGTLVIKG